MCDVIILGFLRENCKNAPERAGSIVFVMLECDQAVMWIFIRLGPAFPLTCDLNVRSTSHASCCT